VNTYRYLESIHWLESGSVIPEWEDHGIRHGFEGLGHELPPFGLHLKQVHGTDLLEVKQTGAHGLAGQGDGLYTQLVSHRVAVKTADCVPVLLHHPEMVMAIHAGWRGVAQDIVGHGLGILKGKGFKLEDCHWGIGPCLSLQSFEIGPDVIRALTDGAFAMTPDEFAWCSMKGKGDRWHLDLAALVTLRLKRVGVAGKSISVIRADTRTEAETWHSYRREGEGVGRNWSWIERGAEV
jgi:YfiH family protein